MQHLNFTTQPKTLSLRTVHQDVVQVHGPSVAFYVSSMPKPEEKYHICQAFTANNLGLSEHSYSVRTLQRRYKHFRRLPLPPVDHAQPLLLIGSQMPYLLTPIKPVQLGPSGGPTPGSVGHVKVSSVLTKLLQPNSSACSHRPSHLPPSLSRWLNVFGN